MDTRAPAFIVHPIGATCTLCRYPMSTGERVNAFIVIGEDGTDEARFVERCIFSSTGGRSPGLPTIESWNYPEPIKSLLICGTDELCPRNHACGYTHAFDEHSPQEIWIHQECLLTLGFSYQSQTSTEPLKILDVWELGKSIKMKHIPSKQQHAAREHCSLREGFRSPHIKAIFPQNRFLSLPMELQEMIISMTKPCASLVVLGESRRLIDCLRSNARLARSGKATVLSLSEKIYITSVDFQGFSYISQISNSPLSSDAKVIHDGSRVSTIRKLTDHLGILEVQFFDQRGDELEISLAKAPWYQIIERPKGAKIDEIETWSNVRSHIDLLGALVYKSKGLFLRSVRSKATKSVVKWDVSVPPNIKNLNGYGRTFKALPQRVAMFTRESRRPSRWVFSQDPYRNFRPRRFPESQRVKCVAMNGDISGLTMHRTGTHNVASFQAHSRMEQVKAGNGEPDANLTIYFPISAGEFIEQAWIQEIVSEGRLQREPTLVVQTNLKRSCAFGPCISHTDSIPTNHALTQPSDGSIATLFYNDPLLEDWFWITHFGVSCSSASNQEKHLSQSLIPPLPNWLGPDIHNNDILNGSTAALTYMTSASLENVRAVQTCIDTNQSHRPVMGLLLHYFNGTREALGQWCPNLTCSNLISDVSIFSYNVDSIYTILMPCGQLIPHRYYIRDVAFSASARDKLYPPSSDLVPTTRPLQGNIKWWIQQGSSGQDGGDFLTFSA
ncbi:MAG: hypothetical protein M1812_000634 [Candelaria pacifica]|nr:MAG: hypothetical protein M1812_000634 [Candelaria pacifica]